MLATYRRALGIPGALRFSMAGLVARLPISMLGLGVVILISSKADAYALAGAVSATLVIAEACCAILQARLLDRVGQARVLVPMVACSMAALVMLLVAVRLDWPHVTLFVFAAVCGATFPMVGGAVRTRWAHVTAGDKPTLQTAYSFEAVLDEVAFVVGPTLVALLATLQAYAGLAVAVVSATAGTLWFAAQRTTEPPAYRPDPTGTKPPIDWRMLGPLAVIGLFYGALFGAAEVIAVAFCDEHGHKSWAGVLLACWSLGSLLSGIVFGVLDLRMSHAARVRWALTLLGLCMLPLPFLHSLPLVGLTSFVAGWTISPGMISAVSWIEQSVPHSRLTEGMAIFTTALAAGVAPGAAISGLVIDHWGTNTAYWVPIAAGFLGAGFAFIANASRPTQDHE
ncbi:MAG: MFS transporter [Nocardioidaceae bacterium]